MKFHIDDITRGIYGTISKLEEEILEFKDAIKQDSLIMANLELADMYGALEGLANSNNLSMLDLKKMSDITKRARFQKQEHLDLYHEDLLAITDVIQYVIEKYKFTECSRLPWHVSDKVIEMTTKSKPHKTMDGNFVGSAEQSFLQLMLDNKLDKSLRYVGFTPCLRDDVIDSIHDRQFYKAEMFSFSDYDYLDDFTNIAIDAFKFLKNDLNISKVKVDDNQIDLYINNIEVGSYCRKEFENYKWVCGTLLAMPRFRIVCDGKA